MASHLLQPYTFQEVLSIMKSLGKNVCIGDFIHQLDILYRVGV